MEISIKLPDPLQIAKEGLLEEVMACASFNADWAMKNKDLTDETRELVHYAARHVACGVLDILDGNTDQGTYVLLPMSCVTGFSDELPTMAGNLSETLQDIYEKIND